MRKFKIPVSWEMYGFVTVEAEDLEQAIEMAEADCIPLPSDEESSYIDGSWRVDYAMVHYAEDDEE